MSLSSGEKLGPYEIIALIGAGGMGEVYRARDPRLGREVAIKISAERFTERFEREARAIASLNHPNICTLYDVGTNYLVMELVEGTTLAERIAEGPIPLEEALNIARQIADALEAAHETGITHRDLKPGNIKIKPDGAVKVLDFGLAKMATGQTAPMADSPTFTMATQVGAILGTAAYMAPEQAKGKPVDKRADIWAFGVVLYEMLTGRPAFTGETVADVMASVVKEQPGLAALPLQVRAVVARCLSKDPRSRWRDIGDVRWALDHVDDRYTVPAQYPLWPLALAAICALAVPAAWFLKPKPDLPLLQMEITAPEGTKFGPVSYAQLALSPDGRRLTFLATGKDGKSMLWVRLLAATGATALAGTENATRPMWSPDSRWIGFHAAGKLQKVDVMGGPPQVLCETTVGGTGTWNSGGIILFGGALGSSGPIQRVSAAGGTPTPVFSLDATREEMSQLAPWFLPDGRHFLFTSFAAGQPGIMLGSLDSKTQRYLFQNRSSPASYAPNPAGGGWILYIEGSTLMARPFDPDKREFTGEAAAIADSMFRGPSWSTSANGLLAFRRAHQIQTQLTWFNRDGKQLGTAGDPIHPGNTPGGRGTLPRISPDHKTVAFCLRGDDGNTGLWLFNIPRGSFTRFTLEPGDYTAPLWSPDGSRILYGSLRKNSEFLVERAANGIGAETVVKGEPGSYFSPSGLSRDSQWVVTEGNVLLSLASGKTIPLQKDGSNGSISPNGRWLLYTYPRSLGGRRDVFIETLPVEAGGSPGAVGKWQISNAGGGANPVWRGDGKEIFYLSSDGKMMAVPVESGENFFRPGTPKALFQTQLPQNIDRDYDVTADGQRFLIDQPVADSGDEPITVIVNWPKLLQR